MEVTYTQIMIVFSTIVVGLVGAIKFLFDHITNQISRLEMVIDKQAEKLDKCEEKHEEASKKAEYLEGRLEEIERFTPHTIVPEIERLLDEKLNLNKGLK